MSYFYLNKKKKKNLKKENLLLFPLTYKKILLFNEFSNNKQKSNIKSPNKNNLNFIIKKQKQKKDIDNLNKLPKIENSNSNLSKMLKHNLSASEGANKILDFDDDLKKIYKISPLNSDRINNNKFNDDLIKNNGNFIKKVYLNKQLSEVINTDNNLYDESRNKILNKSRDNELIKSEMKDKDNIFNKKLIEYDNKFGTPLLIKKNNNLNYQYNSPSKLKSLYDYDYNFKDEYKYNNQIKDYYYYNSLKKIYRNEKPIKIDNISTKTLYYKKEKKKKNNNLSNIKVKSPEELHFYYISIIQEGKKNEKQEK